MYQGREKNKKGPASQWGMLHLLLGAYILLWLNAGNFQFVGGYIPAAVKFGLVLIWLVLGMLRQEQFLGNYLKISWPMLVFLVLLLLSNLSGGGAYYTQYFMAVMYIVILMAMFAYYFYFGSQQELRFLLIVFLIDFAVVAVHTYIELLANPILARAISTSAELQELLLGKSVPLGIGGYGFCYQWMLLTAIIAYYFDNQKKSTIMALLKYAVYACGLVVLFEAQIALAFVLYVVMILVMEFTKQGSTISITKCVLAFLLLFAVVNMEGILQFAIGMAGESMGDRLNELLGVIRHTDAPGGDINTRMNLYGISWDSFWQSPLWGTFGSKPYGSHSTVLDMLAAYGILGLFGVCGLLAPGVAAAKTLPRENGSKRMMILILIAFVVLSMINVSTSSDMMLVLLVIIPLGLRYVSIKTERTFDNENCTNQLYI